MSDFTLREVGRLKDWQRVVAAPGGTYVRDGSGLVVTIWTSFANFRFQVRAQLMTLDGQVVQLDSEQDVVADRLKHNHFFALPECFLLSVRVTAPVNVRRGEAFCSIVLSTDKDPSTPARVGLVHDYVVASRGVFWPGGHNSDSDTFPGILKEIIGADPAAGAEASIPVPAGARWRVHALRLNLTTSATVANRQVYVVVADPAIEMARFPSSGVQAASLALAHMFSPRGEAPSTVSSFRFGNFGQPLELWQGWELRTATENIQAGDDYAAPRVLVEELLLPTI